MTADRAPDVLRRRSLLVGAGLAAAALGGLSACGGGAAKSGQARAASVTAKTAEIPMGGGTIYADAQTVITQPRAGEFKAFSSICTHAGCPLATVTDTINCNCHGSRFALADGAVVTGPATVPLPARQVQIANGTVTTSG